MIEPRQLSEAERQVLWAEVKAEFPDDEMMQEIHFVRLLHNAQFEHLSRQEHAEYLNRLIPENPGKRI